ncbi:MAG: FAD:protein FMN transferase [Candidatus Dormibacteraeota bacterium]|nr:FAD:protein FMN transferase [Candidatus Dormibacteraeota bacterium]
MAPLAIADDHALGTSVRVIVTEAERLEAAKAAVDSVIQDIDRTCSRFRADSELNRLNARAGNETPVSDLLAQAIDEGIRGARVTDGDVDPTVGGAVRVAGYDVDFDSMAPDGPAPVVAAAPAPGWRAIHLDRVSGTVLVERGVEIDLGATAKALASDLAARAALEAMAGAGGVLVSLGGDIAIAGEAPPGGWVIQISEDSAAPIDPAEERVALHTGGLASSSTRVRRWRRGGVEMHHIIDPRTGRPAVTPWRLASVIGGRCVDANIASTAAIVRGAGALDWLEGRGLPARLVGNNGEVVRVAGWPDPHA